jgi:hypothetical protein
LASGELNSDISKPSTAINPITVTGMILKLRFQIKGIKHLILL